MKQNHFLCGALLGLFIGIPLVGYLLGGKGMLLFLVTPEYLAPVVFGYAFAIAGAHLADRFAAGPRRGILQTILILEAVYILGALGGSAANLFINGRLQSPSFGRWNEVWSWFAKPAFWTLYVGVPSAAVVAISYYALTKCTHRHEQS